MADALWHVMCDAPACDVKDMLIFLPSRRAVRCVEEMIVEKSGGAVILPRLVALGEGADDDNFSEDSDVDAAATDDVVPDALRVCALAKLLSADVAIGNIGTALPLARDFIRVTDYLENEGIDIATVDWASMVDARYAAHFGAKARLLNIISRVMPAIGNGRMTRTARRNADIREWCDVVRSGRYGRVIVCASTASVPATADLMVTIAELPYGRIILSGVISGDVSDITRDTHPYNSEYKFLSRIGCEISDVVRIDVGPSDMEFFNRAFCNRVDGTQYDLSCCHLIECNRESEEAAVVAEIAARTVSESKTVLVITPDAAANQRIAAELAARGIPADFSGGVSGAASPAGRAILNLMDGWIEKDTAAFDRFYNAAGKNLFRTISDIIAAEPDGLVPEFNIDDYGAIWDALYELSECISNAGIELSIHDARAFVADCLNGVSIRPICPDGAMVRVLGTIESRMQTADVVILTGLNDGMFPARGYENAWLPRAVASAIGLPSPDRKVSLMSLDFMNLSCGPSVFWTRSKMSGGTATSESRFLSRVAAHGGVVDMDAGAQILATVRAADAPTSRPLNPGVAAPGADWSDVYVTELELLIHNPYAFYARHILRLRPMDDWWAGVDARTFGNLVHEIIEHAHDFQTSTLVAQMDAAAREIVGADSVLFHFWHKRFVEIAPVVCAAFGGANAAIETPGAVQIPVGDNGFRTVRAHADRVIGNTVIDIKTGAAPSKNQLLDGNMPQLPLEAYMLQRGGFTECNAAPNPEMMFLQLRGGDTRTISYDAETTAEMIAATLDKITSLFNQYTAGAATYEYRVQSDAKYRAYDDLARSDD